MTGDLICWPAMCAVCAEPMVVSRAHAMPNPRLEARMLEMLSKAAREAHGSRRFQIDPERKSVPDHWHAHARAGRLSAQETTLGSWRAQSMA